MSRRKGLAWLSILISIMLPLGVWYLVVNRSDGEQERPDETAVGITQSLRRDIPPDYPRVMFSDVTAEAGIQFTHFNGVRSTQLPEDMGSGAAWGDYDNDGDEDIYLVNFAGPLSLSVEQLASRPGNALYRNNGDGSFTDVAASAGVDARHHGMGAVWGDYDGDGDLDLYVTCYGPNILFRNEGDGTFANVTGEAGVGDTKFGSGAAWADFDLDGDLDLYVANYIEYDSPDDQNSEKTGSQYKTVVPYTLNPSSYQPQPNLLYRNNGNGTFTDVAEEFGVDNPTGRSLSVTFCDFNFDRLPDIYVANDVSANGMYQNLGGGQFVDIGASSWAADYRGAMGLAIGDYDNDEDLDIFMTHWIAQENGLYSNMLTEFSDLDMDSLRFRDVADGVGLGEIALNNIGWGTEFLDYDNDGRLDLFVINGSTFEDPNDTRLLKAQKPRLFWNKGEAGYFDVAPVSGQPLGRELVGRGAAFADYDNDGDVDALVMVHGGGALLLRNDGGERNHWLKVRTIGRSPNTRGIGARVRIVVAGASQIREVGAGSSYLSQNSLEVEFGLGRAELIDLVEVSWLMGLVDTLLGVDADQTIVVHEGGGEGR